MNDSFLPVAKITAFFNDIEEEKDNGNGQFDVNANS